MKRLSPLLICYFILVFFVSFVNAGTDNNKEISTNESPNTLADTQSINHSSDKQDEGILVKTPKDKMNYAIGVNIANNLKYQGGDFDPALVMKGFNDVFNNEKLLLNDEDIRLSMSMYHTGLKRKQAKERALAADKNRKEGEDFLEKNKNKEGVITTPSGLQYRIIKAGKGKKPTDTDTVKCNYRGTLINGVEFDSSYRRGKPAEFKVSGVIPGWTEALKLMQAGSRWQIFVPSKLAYGERGASSLIGPNAALIFEIELIDIK
ncbi:FKBP-type peptidyl-prolyl cis-trans isomerase [Desulfobacterium sp. N47]|uniref:Peptidyl-prolyl cis-trans isomerase n=1 Tax=uncultured Desulfobacterium sp. TaxID=201089 RepID=E1YIZ1_9BACT|nr:Outer membrane protein MIP [uncultured Desulfobacterium sp.]